MPHSISYSIQASATPRTAMVRVRIKCRIQLTWHKWQLELPRLLWVSMGTQEAADFVTQQYFLSYPAERDDTSESQIVQAVASSLRDIDDVFVEKTDH